MSYSVGDFFKEHEASDVNGFGIIASSDTAGFRIAEKWLRPEHEGGETWLTYWITEEALSDRVDADKCEKLKELSDKQLDGMRKLATGDGS